jgi:hypothetical protein
MIRALRRAAGLSGSEWRLLLRAFASLVLVDLGLRTRGLPPVLAWIAHHGPSVPAPVDHDAFARAAHYAHWIDVAAEHHILRAHCLHRSLALHAWLRGAGLPSELRIGVRRQDVDLMAHAWVELAGIPANETREHVTLFTPLAGSVWRGGWRMIQGRLP